MVKVKLRALLAVMFFCFLRSSAEGQSTEKNVVHLDYGGSVNSAPSSAIDLALPATTTAGIDRIHPSGLSLGDNNSSYRYYPSWRSQGADKPRGLLKDDTKKTWAVKVSSNWTVTFAFIGKNNAVVDYEDYH